MMKSTHIVFNLSKAAEDVDSTPQNFMPSWNSHTVWRSNTARMVWTTCSHMHHSQAAAERFYQTTTLCERFLAIFTKNWLD